MGLMTIPQTPKFYRQRFLLLLLKMAGGRLSKRDFQKLLFLSQKEAGFSYYDFVPYHDGTYSFQAQSDIESLTSLGWLEEKAESMGLLAEPEKYLSEDSLVGMEQFIEGFKEYRGPKLTNYVYKNYPYYAIHSQIAKDVLDAPSYEKICTEKAKRKRDIPSMYTIGYEGLSLEAYINRLIEYDVRLLCDIRHNPFSRKFGFSKAVLRRLLPKLGIKYSHLPDLGIPSESRQEVNSKADYARLFRDYREALPRKTGSLRSLESLFKEHKRMALTCYEKEYRSCHRHCLSDYLENERNIRVSHI